MYTKRKYSDNPRFDQLMRRMSSGYARQTLQFAMVYLPQAQGKAINKQPLEQMVPQAYFLSELVAIRKQQKLTQADLARLAGTTQATIARIERGQCNPRLDLLFAIVGALGLRLQLVENPQPDLL